jgi:hypothetical protein
MLRIGKGRARAGYGWQFVIDHATYGLQHSKNFSESMANSITRSVK